MAIVWGSGGPLFGNAEVTKIRVLLGVPLGE